MTAAHNLTDLVQLSRELGEPWRRFAILAEGNTSQRVAKDQLAVKATGRSPRHASAGDFVVVSLRRLSDIVDASEAGDAEVARYFDELETEQGRAPSVEARLHGGGGWAAGVARPLLGPRRNAGARGTRAAGGACTAVGHAASDLPGKSRSVCPWGRRRAGAPTDGNG